MESVATSTPLQTDHSGREMLFKVSAEKQLGLITIADNKANVITAINAVLIVLIVIVLSSGMSVGGSPINERLEFVIPLGIILGFGAISAIFAILALKPKIIRAREQQARSTLFFSNYYRKSLDEYKADLQQVMSSREAIYDQLMTDMYHNGLVLERKYALLGIAYTLFLLAIACSVTSYVIIAVM
ncbi:MAG: DUF5706 domain-containing protein [Saprospiraceae bacterium]|nr:DUF5706 domain-containing protein [Saprospiraceae bacterium]